MLRPSFTYSSALFLTIVFIFTASSMAVEITPFRTTNRSPLLYFFGIPSDTSSDLLGAGKWEFSVAQDIASINVIDHTAHEQMFLDGELYRWSLIGKYGLGQNLELGFELPYVAQTGGFLDGFIVNWHDFFGLPQGGRNVLPRNRLKYRYTKDGVSQLDASPASNGISDISLLAGYQLYSHRDEQDHDTLALRAQLKLPTGDSSEMLGSGSTDLALFVTGSRNSRNEWGTVGSFASLGGMYSSDGDILKHQRQNLAGFGTIGTGWSPAEWIAFKLQGHLTSPLYKDSSLRELGSWTFLLTMGGTLKFPDNYLLDIGVGEDILVNSAPDVTFNLALTKRF